MRLIDADALAKAFREAAETDDCKDNRTYWSEALISAAEEVDDAPTVDAVERKRGRWIPIVKGERGYSAGDFRCSVCGDPCKCYHLTNFCQNCGAEMRGKANDE